VISVGHNHRRPKYNGGSARAGHLQPMSMHAEMDAIFNLIGMSPSFKIQGQASKQRTTLPRGLRHIAKLDASPGEFYRGRCREPTGADSKTKDCREISRVDARTATSFRGRAKSWGARRRDSHVNGADLYVTRKTKTGTGNAKPCWGCLKWCRWAGVKKVIHWNGSESCERWSC
jgi:hypothetical protein